MKLKYTFIIFFLLISIVPLTITVYTSYSVASDAIKAKAIDLLESVKEIKIMAVENYFTDNIQRTEDLSTIIAVLPYLKEYNKELRQEKKLNFRFKKYQKAFSHFFKNLPKHDLDYADILIIDVNGNVIYSTAREKDLGTNLVKGKYKNTNLGKTIRSQVKETTIADIDRYPPSNSAALFIVTPIKEKQASAIPLGYLAIQISHEAINKSALLNAGIGNTGETYLIGHDHLLRSDMRLNKKLTLDDSLKRHIELHTKSINKALSGQSGTIFAKDYRNIDAIISYSPINIKNLKWAIIVKKDLAEALNDLNNYTLIISILMLLVLILIALTGYYFRNIIEKPITNVANVIKNIAYGNFNIDIPESTSKNELGELQNASKKLRDDLKSFIDRIQETQEELSAQNEKLTEYKDNLEIMVEERTNELKLSNENLKHSQAQQLFYAALLEELNKPESSKVIIYKISLLIKEYLNLDAIGIRLKEGVDYPYYVSTGFTSTFLDKENYLCSVNEQGDLILDSNNQPYLECMCGNVLSRRYDSSKPFFTDYGSFWTNSTTNLLSSTTEEDRMARTRNYCNTVGFESVALIPIYTDNEILGLLHLISYKPDAFNLELIEYFEKICATVGIVTKRKQLEDALTIEKALLEAAVQEKTMSLTESLNDLNRKQVILDGINKIFREAILFDSLEEVYDVCLRLAQQATNSPIGYMSHFSEDDKEDVMLFSKNVKDLCNLPEDILKTLTVRGLRQKIKEDLSSVIINDIDKDPGKANLPEGHLGLTAYLGVPLIFDNKAIGLIGLANNPKGYDQNDSEIVQSLSLAFIEVINRKRKDLELQAQKVILEETNIELEKANRHKNFFLSSLSHELRTPLNAILGYSDLLASQVYGNLNEKQADYVDTLYTSGKHLLNLIDDILDVTRIDAGKIVLQRTNINVNNAIKEVIELMQPQLNEKQINLLYYPPDGLKYISGDEKRIKQIIINILGNAVKFTPEKGIVEIKTEMSGENEIKISIKDTGPGISEELKEKIFEEFYQVDKTRDTALQGLGIGLAVSRKLVELHDGSIEVDSKQGHGATFIIKFPTTEQIDETFIALTSQQKPLNTVRNKKILVVEDNPVNVTLIKDLLKIYDHEITVANNGQQAIDILQTFKPDIIFMDIRMPVMDGIIATKIIRAMQEFSNIPIIALTASVDPESRQEHLLAGCNTTIGKPINPGELLSSINNFCIQHNHVVLK